MATQSSIETFLNGGTKTTGADGITYSSVLASSTDNIVNPSNSDAITLKKYAKATLVNSKDPLVNSPTSTVKSPTSTADINDNGKPTAVPDKVTPARARFMDSSDQRVRLIVPNYYIQSGTLAAGPDDILKKNLGILFPYTPSIKIEYTANYKTTNVVHSNYALNFYQHSQIGDIVIEGPITVQNDQDAQIWLAMQHLLRALIKMPFGDDQYAGSPPPVCRLYARGDYMFNQTPVAVKSFSFDLPDSVDYYTVPSSMDGSNSNFGISSVPVYSKLSITLVPIYSRSEMLSGTVQGWLTGGQRFDGYL